LQLYALHCHTCLGQWLCTCQHLRTPSRRIGSVRPSSGQTPSHISTHLPISPCSLSLSRAPTRAVCTTDRLRKRQQDDNTYNTRRFCVWKEQGRAGKLTPKCACDAFEAPKAGAMSSRASGELCCGDVGTLSPAQQKATNTGSVQTTVTCPLEWSQTAPRAHLIRNAGPVSTPDG